MRRMVMAGSVLVLACAAVAVADEQDDAKAAKANCEQAQYDCVQVRTSVGNSYRYALGDKSAAWDKYWNKRYKMNSEQRAWCEVVLAVMDDKYTQGVNLRNQAGQIHNSAISLQSAADQDFAAGQWAAATSKYQDAKLIYESAASKYVDAAFAFAECRVRASEVSSFCDSIP
jgi:hypothetical protein